MSASVNLIPAGESDTSFLIDLYVSTRVEEMSVVPWSAEQKQTFLQTQFEAQNLYYRERYPNASFDIIKMDDRPVGRFYLAELADEIRIIDLAFLPRYFDEKIFVDLIEKVLRRGAATSRSVQIYLEGFNPLAEIFARLGFQKVGEHGIYFLWRHQFAADRATLKTSAINA